MMIPLPFFQPMDALPGLELNDLMEYLFTFFLCSIRLSAFLISSPFLGSRSIIVEGVKVEKEAVLGANVVLTGSTKIIDVTGSKPIYLKGYIPEKSVVIPGSEPKKFNAGSFNVPCALIIGKRKESTNKKTSLNEALRDYNVSV